MTSRLPRLSLALLLCVVGCSSTNQSGSSAPRSEPETLVVPIKTGQTQLALAMSGFLPDGWRETPPEKDDDLSLCPTSDPLPPVAPSRTIRMEAAASIGSDLRREEVRSLDATAVLVPTLFRKDLETYVDATARCDGTSTDASTWSAEIGRTDGSTAVTVVESANGGAGDVHASVVQIVDRILMVCRASGRDEDATREAAARCRQRGLDAVEVLRRGPQQMGSEASAAVIAGRVDRVGDGGLPILPVPPPIPCAGLPLQPPAARSVSSQAGGATPAGVPVRISVQPEDNATSASATVQRYVDAAPKCRTDEDLVQPTDTTPAVVMKRTTATTTADGRGAQFASEVEVPAGSRIGSVETEVFAVGAHVVFVTGFGDDRAAASAHVDEAVKQIRAAR